MDESLITISRTYQNIFGNEPDNETAQSLLLQFSGECGNNDMITGDFSEYKIENRRLSDFIYFTVVNNSHIDCVTKARDIMNKETDIFFNRAVDAGLDSTKGPQILKSFAESYLYNMLIVLISLEPSHVSEIADWYLKTHRADVTSRTLFVSKFLTDHPELNEWCEDIFSDQNKLLLAVGIIIKTIEDDLRGKS